ncbi:Rogdi leucine zipper containing protein-domain-containing protein [Syncephalis fuscata]|nr:Rogdi leucine zipper containing protein-domain-containing protein [Syncephalis fuscata]
MLPIPVNSTAAELIQDELEDLNAETDWLLNTEFDTLSMELKSECQDRVPFDSQGETLVLSTPNSENLKGFVRLKGSEIGKGDIAAILSSVDRGQPIRTAFLQISLIPYSGNVYVMIATIHQQATLLEALIKKLSCPKSLEEGKKIMYTLIKQIDHVLVAFNPSPDLMFPKRPHHTESFDPPLSEQLAMEFYLDNTELVAVVRALKYHDTPPTRYRSLIYGWVEPPPVYPWNGRLVEVVETIQVHSPVPSLTNLWNSLRSIRTLCGAYREKITAIEEAIRV